MPNTLNNFLRTVLGAILLLACGNTFAQQPPVPVTVTDSMPATINGLQMGYQVLTAGEKEVADKGNFSRYSLRFFVTNITGEAKMILYKQGFNLGGSSISSEIVRFTCLNATGARLITKMATLQAPACNVLAQVEDKDCAANKNKTNQRFVQIGYWIKAGETIHTDAIVIVPLGEKPNVTAIDMFNANPLVGNTGGPANYNDMAQPQNTDPNAFLKIKSAWNSTYVNNETGSLGATAITDGWWSAQWQLIPAQQPNFYYIKNKWKGTYIATDQLGTAIEISYQGPACAWFMGPVPNSNGSKAVIFKNAMDGTYLNIAKGTLQTTKIRGDDVSARWVLEAQQ